MVQSGRATVCSYYRSKLKGSVAGAKGLRTSIEDVVCHCGEDILALVRTLWPIEPFGGYGAGSACLSDETLTVGQSKEGALHENMV